MSTLQVSLLVLLFLSITLGVLAVMLLVFARGTTLRSRLRSLVQGAEETQDTGISNAPAWDGGVLRAVIDPMSRLAAPSEEAEITRFRERFVRAGLRNASAPLWFFASKAVLALSLPLVLLGLLRWLAPQITGTTSLLLVFVASAIGYYLPNYVVDRMTRRRQSEILEAFPDALDLLVVCVEAGLGLDLAIVRVSDEIGMRSKVLSDEFKLVGLDLRVGSTRERAMVNLVARIGLDDIASFVSMLLQADRFGTSLADSLRVHADVLRTKRRLRAEEEAAKIALKMLFPLIFFVFPTLLLVLMGPAVIQIYRVMVPSLGQ